MAAYSWGWGYPVAVIRATLMALVVIMTEVVLVVLIVSALIYRQMIVPRWVDVILGIPYHVLILEVLTPAPSALVAPPS